MTHLNANSFVWWISSFLGFKKTFRFDGFQDPSVAVSTVETEPVHLPITTSTPLSGGPPIFRVKILMKSQDLGFPSDGELSINSFTILSFAAPWCGGYLIKNLEPYQSHQSLILARISLVQTVFDGKANPVGGGSSWPRVEFVADIDSAIFHLNPYFVSLNDGGG